MHFTQAALDLVKCSNTLANAESSLAKLKSQLEASIERLDCPALEKSDTTQIEMFFGYSQLKSDGTYKVFEG